MHRTRSYGAGAAAKYADARSLSEGTTVLVIDANGLISCPFPDKAGYCDVPKSQIRQTLRALETLFLPSDKTLRSSPTSATLDACRSVSVSLSHCARCARWHLMIWCRVELETMACSLDSVLAVTCQPFRPHYCRLADRAEVACSASAGMSTDMTPVDWQPFGAWQGSLPTSWQLVSDGGSCKLVPSPPTLSDRHRTAAGCPSKPPHAHKASSPLLLLFTLGASYLVYTNACMPLIPTLRVRAFPAPLG